MLKHSTNFSSLNSVIPCNITEGDTLTIDVILNPLHVTEHDDVWLVAFGSTMTAFTESETETGHHHIEISANDWSSYKGIAVAYRSGKNISLICNGIALSPIESNPQYIVYPLASSTCDKYYLDYTDPS